MTGLDEDRVAKAAKALETTAKEIWDEALAEQPDDRKNAWDTLYVVLEADEIDGILRSYRRFLPPHKPT